MLLFSENDGYNLCYAVQSASPCRLHPIRRRRRLTVVWLCVTLSASIPSAQEITTHDSALACLLSSSFAFGSGCRFVFCGAHDGRAGSGCREAVCPGCDQAVRPGGSA